MKKTIFISLMVGLLCCWSACTEDNSSMGTGQLNEIEVEGLAEDINVARLCQDCRINNPHHHVVLERFLHPQRNIRRNYGIRHDER